MGSGECYLSGVRFPLRVCVLLLGVCFSVAVCGFCAGWVHFVSIASFVVRVRFRLWILVFSCGDVHALAFGMSFFGVGIRLRW